MDENNKLPGSSYHDVKVVINKSVFKISTESYGLKLECDRVGGWQLWFEPGTIREKLIGEEFDNDRFMIYINDYLVFDNFKKDKDNE